MSDILIKGMEMPKNYPYRLTIEADGTVMEHCFGYKAKAIEIPPHGRLIDSDKLLEELSECEMKTYGYKGSCDECEDRNICRERILIQRIKEAPTALEASE